MITHVFYYKSSYLQRAPCTVPWTLMYVCVFVFVNVVSVDLVSVI